MAVKEISEWVEGHKDELIETLIEILRVPAVAPDSGGKGEYDRATYIHKLLKKWNCFEDIRRYDINQNYEGGTFKRPNMICKKFGQERFGPTVWIVVHMDTVPARAEKWKVAKPFAPVLKDGKVYGRGAEDNGQDLVAALFAFKAIKELRIPHKKNLGLILVSDEETGSKFGFQHVIKKNVLKEEDFVLAPDVGNSDGSLIETAEKSILWLGFRVHGKQVHASTPGDGLNAGRIGSILMLALDEVLHERFDAEDIIFSPRHSTFEPTLRKENVKATNIVPGEDVFHFDCRVIPRYNLDEILKVVDAVVEEVERDSEALIECEILLREDAAPPTPVSLPEIQALKEVIREILKVDAKCSGVGGGTLAKFSRDAGIDSIAWNTTLHKAHQPDEYCAVKNLLDDCKVFTAWLALVGVEG